MARNMGFISLTYLLFPEGADIWDPNNACFGTFLDRKTYKPNEY